MSFISRISLGASGDYSQAFGVCTTSSGIASHAEGYSTCASGDKSHAEGSFSTASGCISHAEGFINTASGIASHAEGYSTTASGYYSHTEGSRTGASGFASHAEGSSTCAYGVASHSEGYYTKAQNNYMHVSGKYNVGTDTNTIVEVGIGTSDTARANALEIYTDGRVIAPALTPTLINTLKSLITKEYLLSPDFGSSLPTTDPGIAGQLWNNNGVVTVSNGGGI